MAISETLAQAILASSEVPDIVGRFDEGQRVQRENEARIKSEKARAIQGQIVGQRFSPGSQLAELAGIDPAVALQTAQALNIPTDQPARLKQFAERLQVARAQARTDPQGAIRNILQFRDQLNLQGIETPSINSFVLEFQRDPLGGADSLDTLGQHFEGMGLVPESPETKRAKAKEAETFKTDEQIRLEGVKQKGREAIAAARRDEASSKLTMGSTEILEDGTTIAVTSGGTVVRNPDGAVVKGAEAAAAVLAGRKAKVDNAIKSAGGKKKATLEEELDLKALIEAGVVNAKNAATASVKAFDSLGKVRKNMVNLDIAIEAIDAGADTGAIQQYLPSVRTASVELKNVRNRLGLDVIGDVTFGALSKGELDLALATAIPTGLDEVALRDWLVRKKNAQEVYSDYLHAAGVFLGTAGNTIADWQQKQEAKGQGRVTGADTPPAQGGVKFLGFE